MHMLSASLPVLAQAATAALPASEWWQDGWVSWLLTLGVIVVPTFVALLLAKQLRVSDMWARLAAVLVAAAAGAVIVALGWPPRLGIDLKGGLILVYEIDRSKQIAGRVDECIARIQPLVSRREGGGVERTTDGRIAVRLGSADPAARQALLDEVAAIFTDPESSTLSVTRCPSRSTLATVP